MTETEDLFAAARAAAKTGPEFCERCSGKGWLLCERAYHGDRSEFWKETCPECHGTWKKADVQCAAKPSPASAMPTAVQDRA